MKKITNKGFSLLELILVLGVGTMVAFMKFQDMKNEQEDLKAKIAGQQIKQIGEAVNGYINIRYDKLSTLVNSSGNGIDPGPRSCSGSVCEITYQTLVNEGLLPSSYTGINAFRSPYKIILRRDGVSPNYVINGLISTSSSWTENSAVRYDLLGKSMQEAGIDSGVTKTTTSASGYNAQWTETASNFTNITSAGQLAFRTGYNSALYSIYLRRDGTLPMTGDLNMGGNNISSVKDITSTGNITTNGNLLVNGTSTLNGAVTAGKTISVFSDITSGGNIFAKLGVSTNGNMYALGDIAVGSPGSSITAPVAVAYMSASEGSLYAKNIIKTDGTITASGNIEGNTLQPSSYNTIGATCSSSGLISKDFSGNILSCLSGAWQPIGDQPGTIKMWGTVSAPQGWLELNGQAFDKTQNPILGALYPSGRVPDLRGQFVRAWDHGAGIDSDSSRGILSTQGDAIRNISGSVSGIGGVRFDGYYGSFYDSGARHGNMAQTTGTCSSNCNDDFAFDASRQVPTAPENRPKNIALMYIMKKG